jgi:hypothetical protein
MVLGEVHALAPHNLGVRSHSHLGPWIEGGLGSSKPQVSMGPAFPESSGSTLDEARVQELASPGIVGTSGRRRIRFAPDGAHL